LPRTIPLTLALALPSVVGAVARLGGTVSVKVVLEDTPVVVATAVGQNSAASIPSTISAHAASIDVV